MEMTLQIRKPNDSNESWKTKIKIEMLSSNNRSGNFLMK